jgi:DNA mismatch repair ATPase MutS
LKRQHLRADLIEHLKQVGDISRIVQRFTLKRGDVSDLLSVKKTIDLWEQMIKRLELEKDIEKRKRTKKDWEHIDLLRKRIRILETLADRIQSAVADANDQESESVEEEEQKAILQESTPLAENSVKWTIKPSYVREVRTQ